MGNMLENLDIIACRSVSIRNTTYVTWVIGVDAVVVVVVVVVDCIFCRFAI